MNVSEFVEKLEGYSAGTWILVDNHPYMRLADDIYCHIEGQYVDIFTGRWTHCSYFFGKEVKQIYPFEVQW